MKLILLIITTLTTLLPNTFIENVNNLTVKIESKRDGISKSSINIYNPFFEETILVKHDFEKKCISFDFQNATKEDFTKIKGIDRYLAKNIIMYRQTHGLKYISDFKRVRGIGEKKFLSIKTYVNDSLTCLTHAEQKKYKEKTVKPKNIIKIPPPKLKVEIIFNSRVKILGKWYKVGDFIRSYRIQIIRKNYIKLKKRNSNRTLKLFQEKRMDNVKIDFY